MSRLSRREVQLCDLLADLSSAVTTVALYGDSHPRTGSSIEHLAELIDDTEDKLQAVVIGDELFLDGTSFTRLARHASALVRRLKRCDVEHVTFRAGVTEAEMREFLHDLAVGESGSVHSRPHIVVGKVAVGATAGLGFDLDAGGPDRTALATFRDRVAVVKEALDTLAAGRGLVFTSFDRVSRELLSHLDRNPNPFAHMAPWEGVERWLAVHAHNVCVLTQALARMAGLAHAVCFELGLAGLLHDLGKASEPRDQLERELDPGSSELEIVPHHPKLGLERVLGAQQLPPIVAIVIYEHHLGYAGTGYPKLPHPRRPHPAARLVAVADVLDTLLTSRVGRGVLGLGDVHHWIAANADATLDPDWCRAAHALLETCPYRLGK